MDSIKLEKHQAMKRYKKNQLLKKVIHFCLATVFSGLFLSSPVWLPKLCSSLKHFLFVSLPYMGTFYFGPKCLFIICNIIVVFLVSESKLSSSSPAADIDEEDVKQTKSSSSEGENKYVVVLVEEPLLEKSMKNGEEEDEEVEKEEEEEGGGQEDEEEMEKEEEEKGGGGGQEDEEEEFDAEEENGLPADELYQKAEDFIAKFNEQRRLEDKMLVCSG